MTNYTTAYKSKSGELEEALSKDIFISDAEPSIREDDTLMIEGMKEVMQRDDIPVEGTYFIVDVGHAHLPGLGLELRRLGVDTTYFLPLCGTMRMRNTVAYFAQAQQIAKDNLDTVLGYATLIDCHRDDAFPADLPRYSLTGIALPSADKLRELGITRIVYFSEASVDDEVYLREDFGCGVAKDLRDSFVEYRDAGFELLVRGVDKRPKREITPRDEFDPVVVPLLQDCVAGNIFTEKRPIL